MRENICTSPAGASVCVSLSNPRLDHDLRLFDLLGINLGEWTVYYKQKAAYIGQKKNTSDFYVFGVWRKGHWLNSNSTLSDLTTNKVSDGKQ